MTLQSNTFYYFPEFESGQEKKLLLVQVDIEGHSKLSKDERPAEVMEMKVMLAELLAAKLSDHGFKGMGWQGDGGMFALDVSDNVALVDKAVSSWRLIRQVAERISTTYPHLFSEQLIPLRTSAHVCRVYVHPDPRYWHAEGINAFAKAERDLGRRDNFVITGDLYRELPQESKHEFEQLTERVSVGERSDVYRFASGIPGDRNMDFIPSEIKSIEREVKSFHAAKEPVLRRRGTDGQDSQPILFIVDLQRDFSGDQPLAVAEAIQVAEESRQLVNDALAAGFAVVVTRDWHPDDHTSFKTWPRHCVVDSDGAEFIEQFQFESIKDKVQLANIGADNTIPDYNPYCDPALDDFMSLRAPTEIYVAGIALEYCILATCLASKVYSNRVVALESYIRSAKTDQAEIAWKILKTSGINRTPGNPFG